MAKINARGTRQVGMTYFTERVRPATYNDVERIYYEAWRLRSDGWIQSRIISTRPAAEDSIGHATKHSSAFTLWRKFKDAGDPRNILRLEEILERLGATVVKKR